jgi:hypothetical protein
MPEALWRRLSREWQEAAAIPTPAFRKGPPFPTTPVGLFAELEEVRRVFGELPPPALRRHAHRFVNTSWTLQDVLAHLASWAAEFRREVETLLAGRQIEYAIPFALSVIGPTEWNRAEVEKRRALSLAEVRAQFDEETRRLQDLVLSASTPELMRPALLPPAPSGDPAARMRGSVAVAVTWKCRHDGYHLAQIRRWLAAREAAARS